MKNELRAKNELWKLFETQLPNDVEEISNIETDKQTGIMEMKLKIKGKVLKKKYKGQVFINEL